MVEGLTYVKREAGHLGEEAIVLQTSHQDSLVDIENDPLVTGALAEIGLTPDVFRRLVYGEFTDVVEPVREELTDGGITEDVLVRVARCNGRDIEVSVSQRSNTAEPPSNFEMQKKGTGSSCKILAGLQGKAELRFPHVVDTAGFLYKATQSGDTVVFDEDSIAIIYAPTPWSFVSSEGDFTYVYISIPPYSSLQDTKAIHVTTTSV